MRIEKSRRLALGRPSLLSESTRSASPRFWLHSVTVILPPTPRPLMFRSYIDSANTGGTTNSPRLVDLIW